MLLRSEPIHADLALLILRLGSGGMMLIGHGWPKLAAFGERAESFADPLGLGPTISLIMIVIAEVLCSALVMLGLWTRLTVLPLIIGMAVIVFVHLGDADFGKKELAAVYLVAFLTIFFAGSGRFSVDRISFR